MKPRLLLLFLLLLAAPTAAQDSTSAGEGTPVRNVLFIMGDDHAAYAIGAYGSAVARTPNLDRLAAGGVRFDRAYASSPVCSASRQAILTGKLPHAVGVNLLFTPLSVEEVTVADHLKARGFKTAAIGKMHFSSFKETLRRWGYPESVVAGADDHHGFDLRVDRIDHERWLEKNPPRRPPPGTDVRLQKKSFEDVESHWNTAALPDSLYEESSEAHFFASQAIDYLRENGDERFCLWLSFREPHNPFSFPVELAGRFDPADMPVPAVGPEDERWIPEVFRDVTEEQQRGIAAAYYTSVEHLDRQVGRVLDALEELGLEEETLVVYVGDHGYLLGHHGRFEKHMMWEEAVRSPLIMRHGPRLGQGRVVDDLVEFIDLAPTLVDLLGAEPMPTAQGRSLVPVLDGEVGRHRLYAFSEFLVDDKAMVRTDRWKYVFTAGRHDLRMGFATGLGAPGLTHRLYDLQADPAEQHSLADEPAYQGVLQRMQGLMLERFRATHPEAHELPEGTSAEEALAWFTRPRDPLPDGVPVK